MKINYLIEAHANFENLDRLIDRLDTDGVHFFVHIDKKSKEVYKNSKPNVHLLDDRVVVNWGGFGMTEAALRLMRASQSQERSDYYVLLSGADYPLRSNDEIKAFLSQGYEFINIKRAPTGSKPLSRYIYYHFDYDKREWKKSLSAVLLRICEVALKRIGVRREIPFRLYAGSQWFALTDHCVSFVLNTVENDPAWVNYFKYTFCAEETFLQTIIGNSELSHNTLDNLTYTDWSTVPAPALINKAHIDVLMKNNTFSGEYGEQTALFARKFDHSNLHVMDEIDQILDSKR